MGVVVESRAYTYDVAFGYNLHRTYLAVLVESGTASMSLSNGETFPIKGYYEPIVTPRSAFRITGVTGKVVVVSDALTLSRVARKVPNFNGTNQHAILPNTNLVVGDKLYFSFISPTSISTQIRMMLSSTAAFDTRVRMEPDSALVAARGTFVIDDKETAFMPLDGKLHHGVYTATLSSSFNLIAAQSNGAGGFLRWANFPIFNIKVNDGSIINFPMADGDSILRNLGSGGNGSIVNGTPEMWQDVII